MKDAKVSNKEKEVTVKNKYLLNNELGKGPKVRRK